MKKYLFLIIILGFNIIFCQYNENTKYIDKIGKGNGEYVEVLLNGKYKLDKLLTYARDNKLNITLVEESNHKTIIYQKKFFDPYKIFNNKFDNGLEDFGIKTNIIDISTKSTPLENLNRLDGLSSFILTSEFSNYNEIKSNIENLGFNATYVKSIDFGGIDFLYNIVVLVVILIIILSFILEYGTKKKTLNILKLYSGFSQSLYYLYFKKMLCSTIIIFIISFVFIYIIHIDTIILLKNFGVFLVTIWSLTIFLSLKVNKKISLNELKGKINLSYSMYIFKTLSIVTIIFISFTGFMIFGKHEDSVSLEKEQSKWSMSNEYVNLLLNDSLIVAGVNDDSINNKYEIANNKGAIYFDNSEFLNYQYEMYGETSAKKINDVQIDKYSSIKVNNNYLKKYNLSQYSTNNDITVIIPSKLWQDKNKILAKKCTIESDNEDKTIEDCRAIKIENQQFFVGAILGDNKNGFHDSIIVLYSDKIINNYLSIMPEELYLPYDNNQGYRHNYKNIRNIFNDKKFFSEKGIYSNISNKYLEYQDLVGIMDNSKIIMAISILLFLILIIYFIYNIISIYINSMAKEIAIKRVSGYSLFDRYQSLFYFFVLVICFNIVVMSVYILSSVSGVLTLNYLLFMIVLLLIIIAISKLLIKRLENKSILNVIKGDGI